MCPAQPAAKDFSSSTCMWNSQYMKTEFFLIADNRPIALKELADMLQSIGIKNIVNADCSNRA
jgi:hypothetical protein